MQHEMSGPCSKMPKYPDGNSRPLNQLPGSLSVGTWAMAQVTHSWNQLSVPHQIFPNTQTISNQFYDLS